MGNSKSKAKKNSQPPPQQSKPPVQAAQASTSSPAASTTQTPAPATATTTQAPAPTPTPTPASPPVATETKAPEPTKRESIKAAPAPTPAPAPVETTEKPAPKAAESKRESIKSSIPAAAQSIDANDNDYIEESAGDSHKYPVVLDCGSFLSKAGLSDSYSAPSYVIPTVIGRAKSNTKVEGWLGQKDLYVGKEAEDKEEELSIKWPIDRGMIALSNWEDMEKIWHHLFYSQLRIKPSEHPVVITEAPLTPKANRERTIKIMFNTFKVPALYIGNSAVFSLFASGRVSGAVVELGDACSHVVGVVEGHIIPKSIVEASIAGRDITELMFKMLSDRGITFSSHKLAHDVARELKERFGYVAADYEKEFEVAQDSEHEKTYDAPDGNSFTIGIERFKCAETLFQPSIKNAHLEQVGVHVSTNESVLLCDESIRPQMYGNILLSGGTTMFAGFADRLKAELVKIAPAAGVNIIRPPNRKYSAWVGAALFANEPLVKLLDKLVTKDEYVAQGNKICEARFTSA